MIDHHLGLFIKHIPMAVAMFDMRLCYMAASDRWYADYQLKAEDIIGRHHYDIFPEVPQRWRDIHARNLRGEHLSCAEDPFPRGDGRIDYIRWENVPWYTPEGAQGGVIMFTEVVTEAVEIRDRLRDSEEAFRLALEAASDGVWDWKIPVNRMTFTPQNWLMLGYDREDWPDMLGSWQGRIHPDDKRSVAQNWQRHLQAGDPFDVTYRIKSGRGDWHWWQSRGQALRDEDGQLIRAIGTNTDITEIIRAKELAEEQAAALLEKNAQLEALRGKEAWAAEHDSLTKIPNRRYLSRNWHILIERARERSGSICMLHIDLDHFKRVNNRLGHGAGDAVLIEAVSRLKGLLQVGVVLARVGGVEFIDVLFADHGGRRAQAMGEAILEAIKQPFSLEGHEFRLGASIGVALSTPEEADRDRLVAEADSAMSAAKRAGRFRICLYDAGHAAHVNRQKQLADDLFRALERDEIEPYFQPKVDAATFEIVGVEALARWRHPGLGLLAPDKFVGLAEDLGLISRVDDIIMRKALRGVFEVEAATGQPCRLGVNVSMRRLDDLALAADLETLAMPKGGLAFEILESVFLDTIDDPLTLNLDRIKACGIDIELDDFGSGHTSIISVVRIKPQRIKVDRLIVQAGFEDRSRMAILRAIIEMARELDIAVIAEGVETQAQALVLRGLGLHELQGYYFGAPMSLGDLKARLTAADGGSGGLPPKEHPGAA